MPLWKGLPYSPSKVNKRRYSQNFVVNTVMLGTELAVGETQGKLIILTQPPGGGVPSSADLPEGLILTRQVKLPHQKRRITVDVILLRNEIEVNAALKDFKNSYQSIEVYPLGDVELY